MIKNLGRLFFTFFKIGLFTFGGGYAMLPMLQREIVEKNEWATEEDLASYFAIGQTTPGIIAVNTATFIGFRKFGVLGAVIATAGLVSPGAMIIVLLVNVIENFSQIPQVRHAMTGIKIGVTVLILEALFKLKRSALQDKAGYLIFLSVVAARLFLPRISPAILVLLAGTLGIVLFRVGGQTS